MGFRTVGRGRSSGGSQRGSTGCRPHNTPPPVPGWASALIASARLQEVTTAERGMSCRLCHRGLRDGPTNHDASRTSAGCHMDEAHKASSKAKDLVPLSFSLYLDCNNSKPNGQRGPRARTDLAPWLHKGLGSGKPHGGGSAKHSSQTRAALLPDDHERHKDTKQQSNKAAKEQRRRQAYALNPVLHIPSLFKIQDPSTTSQNPHLPGSPHLHHGRRNLSDRIVS